MSLDQQLFLWIQELTGNSFLDQIMLFFAEYLVIFVPISLIYLWFSERTIQRKELTGFTAYSTVLSIGLSYAMGLLYFHENPSATFETIVAHRPENAFPSQHTTTILATSLPLIYKEYNKIGGFLLASGLLTGFARIYIGEHWPLDIFGAFIAAAIGLLIAEFSWEKIEFLWRPLIDYYQEIEGKILKEVL